jgi:ABC-type phosphate transport system substrate-binding protein
MGEFMKFGRVLLVVSAIVLAGVSGCTPPMPPDVKAALAEEVSPCVADGNITANVQPQYLDLVQIFADDYTGECPNSSINVVSDSTNADISFSDQASPVGCDIVAGGPIAYDAAALVHNQLDVSEVNLKPQTVSKLLSGQIKNWADPSLVADNPDAGLLSTPLVLQSEGYGPALDALNSWGHQLDPANWSDTAAIKKVSDWNSDTSLTAATAQNSVGVTPLSVALNNSLTTAAIQLPGQEYPVVSDLTSTYAATGQLKAVDESAQIIRTIIDPKLSALKADGADQAAQPWAALYPVNEYICKGSQQQAARAFARYVLRGNEQAQNESYYVERVPEAIRLITAGVVAQGLPEPSATPGQ